MENQKIKEDEKTKMFINLLKEYVPPFKELVEGGISVMVAANTADFSHLLKKYNEIVLENESLKRELSDCKLMIANLNGLIQEIKGSQEEPIFKTDQTDKTVN